MKNSKIILCFILLSGFLLRLGGLNFGLPLITHADEPIIVNHALAYGLGDFNPHFFNIPPLVSYLLFIIYGLIFVVGKMLGFFVTKADYLEKFLLEPTFWYITGRFLIGVCLGTVSVYALYKLTKEFLEEKMALLAALFFAVSYIHILHSHYIYTDIPLTLSIILAAIFSLKLYKNPSFKNYIIAGFLVGLSCAVKYNGLISAVFVVFAHFLSSNRRSIIRPALSIISCVSAFFIFNPFAFFDLSFFKKEILEQSGAEGAVGWWYHLKYSLAQGLGWPMVTFGLLGAVWVSFKERKKSLVLLSFPVLFFISLGIFSQKHERYVLPLVPFVCIYAAYFVYQIKEKLYFKHHVLRFAFYLTLVFSVILPNLAKSIWLDYIASRKDTRILAKEWIEKNIAPGSNIAMDHTFFCPRLFQTKQQLSQKIVLAKAQSQKAKLKIMINSKIYPQKTYNVYYLWRKQDNKPSFLSAYPTVENNLSALKRSSIEYVVIHKDICGKKDLLPIYELKKQAKLIAKFSPHLNRHKLCSNEKVVETALPFVSGELFSRERPGYPLYIYKLK